MSAPGTCRRTAAISTPGTSGTGARPDGGVTWTAPVKISDVTSGASYKTANGFLEPYGDYGETAITSAGKTVATWGEGNSYTGPGGVWVNRQT